MSQTPHNAPLLIDPAPDIGLGDFAPLLEGPFAKTWDQAAPAGLSPALRARLLARLAVTRQAESGMVTTRRKRAPLEALAPGVRVQTLYTAQAGRALRPGEP